jgi:hypothetical protein
MLIPTKVPVLVSVLYWRPDFPHLLNRYDQQLKDEEVPNFPRLVHFLEHWRSTIDAVVNDVFVDAGPYKLPRGCRPYGELYRLQ